MTLRLQTSGRRDVRRWLLALGADAELLQPAELREEIAAELRAMLGAYSGE